MSKGIKLRLSKTYINSVLCFIPSYQSDREIVECMPKDVPLNVVFRKDRNPKLHDKFMAILRAVVANSAKWQTVDQLIVALKYKLHLIDFVKGFDGSVYPNPRSISFDAMDDLEFNQQVYKPSISLLSKEIGIQESELETNFGEYL